jgi:hypothetical protein
MPMAKLTTQEKVEAVKIAAQTMTENGIPSDRLMEVIKKVMEQTEQPPT